MAPRTAIPPTTPPRSLDLPPLISLGLERVGARVAQQLTSDVPEVHALCRSLEKYRGKMLRPTLSLLCAHAVRLDPLELVNEALIVPDVVTVASVVEMIHLATLVHDDVLDEAETRRGHATINRIEGNEVAVILGDFLISQSFHLCSSLDTQKTALRVGEITSAVCAGELLQLARRGDAKLDEPTYFRIIERKTAALIGLACEVGARHAGADEATCTAMYRFGMHLGIAFQIQDDLLDLIGDEAVVGKPLGKDIEKGKVTLPVLHHMGRLASAEREAIEARIRTSTPLNGSRSMLAARLDASGSIEYARRVAREHIERALGELACLGESAARERLAAVAESVIDRQF